MRLNKYIRNSGITSRRGADKLIEDGKVKINEIVVTEPFYEVSNSDCVKVEDKKIKQIERFEYYIINKPIGFLSSLSDPFHNQFVSEIVKTDARIYPVGRLDLNSRGLMILTNDGDLAFKISHPNSNITKEYIVKLDKKINNYIAKKFEAGIKIDDKSKVKGRIKEFDPDNFLYSIKIKEGRNRQVRKMFKSVGIKVLDLNRVSIGGLKLGDLKIGHYKKLIEIIY